MSALRRVPNPGVAKAEALLSPEDIIIGFELLPNSFAFGSSSTRGVPSLDGSEVAVWFPVLLLLPEVVEFPAEMPGFEMGSDPGVGGVAGEDGTEKSSFMSRGSGVIAARFS